MKNFAKEKLDNLNKQIEKKNHSPILVSLHVWVEEGHDLWRDVLEALEARPDEPHTLGQAQQLHQTSWEVLHDEVVEVLLQSRCTPMDIK